MHLKVYFMPPSLKNTKYERNKVNEYISTEFIETSLSLLDTSLMSENIVSIL